jgi:hypothetical protein
MSDGTTITASSPSSFAPAGFDAGVTGMSADSLLAYCQMQLGDLDGQINNQMTAQKTALREREAVQSAQATLGQFGTAGPQTPEEMQQCVTALNNAIAQLPTTDPVVGQLTHFRDQMTSQYGYQAGRELTPDELTQLAQAKATLLSPPDHLEGGARFASSTDLQRQAQDTIDRLQLIKAGTFTKPNADIKEWQGTTDALNTVADDIKSSAEIQLLDLQNLVSQRQQAIALCSGILSKTDQSLEDQAKAIGR